VHSAHALAGMRTVRRVPAVVEAVAPVAPAASEGVEMVMAEIRSEADSILEDGSNDSSASQDAGADSEAEVDSESDSDSVHGHFRQFTAPMSLLPNDHTTLVEVDAAAGGEEGGEDKGSNPTYILPVDPFNYFPFFNGFSNVNPFSQFYPPAPYLYPQYTNYMHQYANHGAGHPPGYPYPGTYGGVGAPAGAPGMYGGAAHAGFPHNYPGPSPHMHYPFGAYKMDVSGPDVRTGSNNPPPFPQFSEVSSSVKLIRPEIIPKAEVASADESDVEEEGDSIIASFIEISNEDESEAEADDEDSTEVEFESESEAEAEEASDVEILDESSEEDMSSDHVEFESEEGSEDSDELEYTD